LKFPVTPVPLRWKVTPGVRRVRSSMLRNCYVRLYVGHNRALLPEFFQGI
jgi:hypothetical protein